MSSAQPLPNLDAKNVHTISLFVNNKPGVLVRVSLVFSRRAFNIESLVVSPAAEGRFSRMTITSSGSSETLEQIGIEPPLDKVIGGTGLHSLHVYVPVALPGKQNGRDFRIVLIHVIENFQTVMFAQPVIQQVYVVLTGCDHFDSGIEIRCPV